MTRLIWDLPSVDAETAQVGIRRTVDLLDRARPANEMRERYPVRASKALLELCKQRLVDDADTDRATLVIHTLADVFDPRTDDISGRTLLGTPVYADTIRRMACDARIQFRLYDRDGNSVDAVGIGQTSRVIPAWLRRRVLARDQHCRFPGCTSKFRLQLHHVDFYGHNGPTDESNLAPHCDDDHDRFHGGGWRCEGDANGVLTYYTPQGNVFGTSTPPLADDLVLRFEPLLNPAGIYPSPVTHPGSVADHLSGELFDLEARRQQRFQELKDATARRLEHERDRDDRGPSCGDDRRAPTGTDPP